MQEQRGSLEHSDESQIPQPRSAADDESAADADGRTWAQREAEGEAEARAGHQAWTDSAASPGSPSEDRGFGTDHSPADDPYPEVAVGTATVPDTRDTDHDTDLTDPAHEVADDDVADDDVADAAVLDNDAPDTAMTDHDSDEDADRGPADAVVVDAEDTQDADTATDAVADEDLVDHDAAEAAHTSAGDTVAVDVPAEDGPAEDVPAEDVPAEDVPADEAADDLADRDEADVVAVGDGGAAASGEASDLRPGAAEPFQVSALWADGDADGIRERWRALQLRFIDDPRSVAGEAEQLVDEAVTMVITSFNAQRDELGAWQSQGGDDTEQLRSVVRQYRDFLDRLLGL